MAKDKDEAEKDVQISQAELRQMREAIENLQAQLREYRAVKAGLETIPLDEHTKESRLEMAVRYLAGECHVMTQVDDILGGSEAARERPVAAG